MLQERFGFGNSAGTFYALPYIISGICSPILGIIIDKIGKRALFSKYHTYQLLQHHYLTIIHHQVANRSLYCFLSSYDIICANPVGLYNHDSDP